MLRPSNGCALLLALPLFACAAPESGAVGAQRTLSSARVEKMAHEDTQGVPHTSLSHELPAAPEQAWVGLVRVVGELGLGVAAADERQRVLLIRDQRVRRRLAGRRLSRYLDCGENVAGSNADNYDVYLTLRLEIVPGSSGGSRVATQLVAFAHDPATNSAAVRCATRNRLEPEIAARVAEKAGAGAE